jgi:hypothetical protein
MNCEFAHEIVAKLDQLYACNDLATKQLLRQQWQSLRYVFDDDIHEFLCRFDGLVTDLQSAGCQLSDEEIVSQLLISMPREYNVTVKILRKMRDLNIQIAKQSLIADYNEERIQRQVSASGLSRHGNLSGGFNRNLTSSKIGRDTQGRNLRESKEHTQPFRCSLCGRRGHLDAFCRTDMTKVQCFDCGKTGHIKNSSKCRVTSASNLERVESGAQHTGSQNPASFFANEGNNNYRKSTVKFKLDSGASDHFCNRNEVFRSSRILEKPLNISTAKEGVYVQAYESGQIFCPATESNETSIINDVKYVPSLKENLLSVGCLAEKNYITVFSNRGAEIIDENDGRIVFTGKKVDRLFEVNFDFDDSKEHVANFTTVCDTRLWHSRLAHINMESLKNMCNKKLIPNFRFNNKDIQFCEPCTLGKQTSLPYKTSINRASRKLELIHTDVCYIGDDVLNGFKYFVTFLDDFSHFCVVYLIQTKDEAFSLPIRFEI